MPSILIFHLCVCVCVFEYVRHIFIYTTNTHVVYAVMQSTMSKHVHHTHSTNKWRSKREREKRNLCNKFPFLVLPLTFRHSCDISDDIKYVCLSVIICVLSILAGAASLCWWADCLVASRMKYNWSIVFRTSLPILKCLFAGTSQKVRNSVENCEQHVNRQSLAWNDKAARNWEKFHKLNEKKRGKMENGISDCHRWRRIMQAKENNGGKKKLESHVESAKMRGQ